MRRKKLMGKISKEAKEYKYLFYTLAYLKKYWGKLAFILLMSVVTVMLSLVGFLLLSKNKN